MDQGKWREAFKLAQGFSDLGDEKAAIKRAWEAFVRPEFLRQLKRDPEQLIREGQEALRRRYAAPENVT